MSNINNILSDAQKNTLNIVNTKFWEEQTVLHEKDKDIVDTMGYAEQWGLAMQREMARQNTSLTKELAEQTKPQLPQRMTYQIMAGHAKEILYAAWAYGAELAEVYGENKDQIQALRAYASDENAQKRARPRETWRDKDAEHKRRLWKEKRDREQKYIRMDEALLASMADKPIEFTDEARLESFFKDHPTFRRNVTLFLKLCQETMREENSDTLTRSIISLARSQIHTPFPESEALDHAIICAWKHGEKYGECMGYLQHQIRRILPPVSRVVVKFDENGR